MSVYGNLIRKRFKHTPIIIGGIEASLRRLAHYDYWSDSLKRSILLDSNADLLIYGMGEHAIHEVADSLAAGIAVQDITYVAGTVYRARDLEATVDPVMLPSYQEMLDDKTTYAKSFYTQYMQHGLPLRKDPRGAVRGAPLRGAEPPGRAPQRRRARLCV